MAPPQTFPVTLNLYDVTRGQAVRAVNDLGQQVGLGALHAGVEVHGLELSFAGHEYGGSGIISYTPRQIEAHAFREALPMGETKLTKNQLAELLRRLQPAWPADGYDLLRRNCCTFADALCVELGVGHIPERVNRLAGVGATLVDGTSAALEQGIAWSRVIASSGEQAIRQLDAQSGVVGGLHAGLSKGLATGLHLTASGLAAASSWLAAAGGGGGAKAAAPAAAPATPQAAAPPPAAPPRRR